jgi:hypothetical protein
MTDPHYEIIHFLCVRMLQGTLLLGAPIIESIMEFFAAILLV